jgi:hypothetical protein
MNDTKLEHMMRCRIKEHDYEAVFAHGECFRFALRLHKRWGYEIHGIRCATDETRWGHVWAAKGDGKGIDIRGIYLENFLAMLANASMSAKWQNIDIKEIQELVGARKYPQDLSAQLDFLADWVVDTHERFSGAKPFSGTLREIFEGDKNANEQEAPDCADK